MKKLPLFAPHYTCLEEVLNDKNLARLGDAYINFIYSIALSRRIGKATGAKVSSRVLAQALKKAELRGFLQKRMDRHALGDAAEALVAYAYLCGVISIEESVEALLSADNAAEGFANFLCQARERLSFNPAASEPTL